MIQREGEKALTGAWKLVRNLSNKNQKLEQENAELKRQNQIWREETTPEQFQEIANKLERNHCRSWKQYKDRQKRLSRNQESGIGY
jgi:cation transport regulator ChaB